MKCQNIRAIEEASQLPPGEEWGVLSGWSVK